MKTIVSTNLLLHPSTTSNPDTETDTFPGICLKKTYAHPHRHREAKETLTPGHKLREREGECGREKRERIRQSQEHRPIQKDIWQIDFGAHNKARIH